MSATIQELPNKQTSKANQASAKREPVPRLPDGRTYRDKELQDACLLRLKAREAAQMALVDVDAVLAGIAGGRTQAELAAEHGVNASTLSIFLNSQTGDLAKRIAAARKAAADALADRALQALEDANEELSGSVQLAGLKAKHFQWRAATADRQRFAERPSPEQQPPSGNQIPAFTIQILGNSQSNQEVRVIEHDSGESLI